MKRPILQNLDWKYLHFTEKKKEKGSFNIWGKLFKMQLSRESESTKSLGSGL